MLHTLLRLIGLRTSTQKKTMQEDVKTPPTELQRAILHKVQKAAGSGHHDVGLYTHQMGQTTLLGGLMKRHRKA